MDPDFVAKIARFTLENGFTAVLSPTHVLTQIDDPMLLVDRQLCLNLRRALDRLGASNIAIDYEATLTPTLFRDPIQRTVLKSTLCDLPFENLWFRVFGFGADASSLGVRNYIEAVRDFEELRKPIVADGVAGFAGLALIAFGGVSALAHGVGDLERCDARDWLTIRSGFGGLRRRVLVPALDRYLEEPQVSKIVAIARGRKLLSCSADCCRQGIVGAFEDPEGHYLRQRKVQIESIAAVQPLKRGYHLINQMLAPASRVVRELTRFNFQDENLERVFQKSENRHARLLSAFESLDEDNIVSEDLVALLPRWNTRRLLSAVRAGSKGSPWLQQ